MAQQDYPLHYKNEVWNAPIWVFSPGVSLTPTQAAHALGFKTFKTVLRHADRYGLTVYRHPKTQRRYFLKSEIAALKDAMETLTSEQISGNGHGSGLLESVKPKKRRGKR